MVAIITGRVPRYTQSLQRPRTVARAPSLTPPLWQTQFLCLIPCSRPRNDSGACGRDLVLHTRLDTCRWVRLDALETQTLTRGEPSSHNLQATPNFLRQPQGRG